MELKDLRFFVLVYETKGFLRAGEQLHTVQSNVSVRIRNLERTVGKTLFIRLHRGIQPTDAAHALYEPAKGLIELADRLEEQMRLGGTAADSARDISSFSARTTRSVSVPEHRPK
jgi:DNA-binding transcriptional LysR family regulator